MSGGVDSSATAALLMEAGFEVCGVTCVFVDDEYAQAAVADARSVAAKLGVEHVVRDCTQTFSRAVVSSFVDSYAQGLTPSPCVVCNRDCKIPSLIEAADEMGCRYVATGHYARVVRRRGRFAAARAAYAAKDQSYMLAMLSQEQLARLIMPLGSLAGGKPEVRLLAAQRGLSVASKSESQDICFIHGSHLYFLSRHGVIGAAGNIVTEDGRVVGRHGGLFRYTIGQRKGLDIGGAPEPYYVVEKRPEENELVVAFARDARIGGARVAQVSWQGIAPADFVQACAERGPLACAAKVRYRQQAAACRVFPADMRGDVGLSFVNSRGRQFDVAAFEGRIDSIDLAFDTPQSTTAPGQYAVLYDGDAVLCGGVIESLIRDGR